MDTFEAFLCGSIFNKTAFYLGEKQGILVSDECRSWYNSIGNFFFQFGISENSFVCKWISTHGSPKNTLQNA